MLFILYHTAFSQEVNNSIVIDELDGDTIETIQDTQTLILESQPTQKQWTVGNKKIIIEKSINQKKISPCQKYKTGKRILKAGLVTGIIGSGILTATIVYAANNHDPYGQVAIPGVIGLSSSVVSINLTIIGKVIKGCNKKKCLDRN